MSPLQTKALRLVLNMLGCPRKSERCPEAIWKWLDIDWICKQLVELLGEACQPELSRDKRKAILQVLANVAAFSGEDCTRMILSEK